MHTTLNSVCVREYISNTRIDFDDLSRISSRCGYGAVTHWSPISLFLHVSTARAREQMR